MLRARPDLTLNLVHPLLCRSDEIREGRGGSDKASSNVDSVRLGQIYFSSIIVYPREYTSFYKYYNIIILSIIVIYI